MGRILALVFWTLWARKILDRRASPDYFRDGEKGGAQGSREGTNPAEQDGEADGLGLASGYQLVLEGTVRKQ